MMNTNKKAGVIGCLAGVMLTVITWKCIALCPGVCKGVNFLGNCNFDGVNCSAQEERCYLEKLPDGYYTGPCCPDDRPEDECNMVFHRIITSTKWGKSCYNTSMESCNGIWVVTCKCSIPPDATAEEDEGLGDVCLQTLCGG
jgi:hypothetical protein